MSATRYEEVNVQPKERKVGCCIKFWLVFFIIATLALVGVILWLVIDSTNLNTPSRYSAGNVGQGGPLLGGASSFSQPGYCSLSPSPGSCKAKIQRFYFDSTSGTCKTFFYSGCSGNSNNFENLDQCINSCLPKPEVTVPSGSAFENSSSETSVCQMPLEHGNCLAFIKRWGFVPEAGKCEEFVYGGCGGNANNFETMEDCEKRCQAKIAKSSPVSGITGTRDSVCDLPQDAGPCRGSHRRWSFDSSKGMCVEFTYGGCRGNANNFETNKACESKCNDASNIQPRIGPGPDMENINNLGNGEDAAICHLPHERGNCFGYIPRWGFEPISGKCVQFMYSGCDGNVNNFESREACELLCVAGILRVQPVRNAETLAEVCKLPKDAGPCRSSQPRWAFEMETGNCVQFVYGGCRGNENNFKSKQECEQRCSVGTPKPVPVSGQDTLDDVCNLPQAMGPCTAMQIRWAFDAYKGTCVEFTYGGCRGNANNFQSKTECESKCGVVGRIMPMNAGDTAAISGGNEDTTNCHLPLEQGNCFAYKQRWGFDISSGQCVQFFYGGCGGNENNFESRKACEERCIASSNDASPEECQIPQEVGPCRANMRRWWYDSSSGECVQFTYGGCRGNANNFETKEACEVKCGKYSISNRPIDAGSAASPVDVPSVRLSPGISSKDNSICYLPLAKGDCYAYVEKWGFDTASGQCISFIYSGCGGNANIFDSRDACEQLCVVKQPDRSVCSLPRRRGPCRGNIYRYYYDKYSNTCDQFVYGGCSGNANNFESKEDCESRCVVET